MNEEAIYKFDGLKKLLTSLGFSVEKAQGYREIENVDVDINDLRNNISFTPDGIFLNCKDGSLQQIFLYKRNYKLNTYGKPRFHIRECETIQSFIASGTFHAEYRRANTKEVLVCDIDDGFTDKIIGDLPLCSHCARLASLNRINTSDFVEILKQSDEASEKDTIDNLEIDIFGYTKNWEQISQAYRELKEYTCERCGIKIENPLHRHFMHVHHRNGDKTNNRTSNLECLCIRCHSIVDNIHKENFSTKANQENLVFFNNLYPPQHK